MSLTQRLIQRACLALWLGSVLALGGIGIGRSIALAPRPSFDPPDFATYYLASRMLDIQPTSIYDSEALKTLTTEDGPRAALLYTYPPFFAGAIRPLARMPYRAAVSIWLILDTTFLLGGLIGLLALLRWPGRWKGIALAGGLLLLFTPAHEAVLLGQVSPILFLLIVLALLVLDRSTGPAAAWLAGILVGIATLIKIFPAIIVVYFLVRRRWTLVAGCAVGGMICILLGLLWGGGWVNTWNYFFDFLPSLYTQYMELLRVGNQSLTALFMRPMGIGPATRIVSTFAILLVLAITWWAILSRHPQRLTLEVALVSMLPLLILSAVYTHMYVLIILPLGVLAKIWYTRRGQWMLALNLLSFLLLIINSYAEWVDLRLTVWVPFGLIGTLIVWGMLVRQVMQPAAGEA